MPRMRFTNVSKSYGSFQAVSEFTADIGDTEFLVLLGPSGCGKSTLLRMIAGLTDITSGELEFDGTVVNDQTPHERNAAFVFQSYALYPHMSVRGNIAFPLLMEHFRWYHHLPFVGSIRRRLLMRSSEIRSKVEEIARIMGIEQELDKRPKALSGGQRQRVAVARALVRQPSLYLLDEPLSNLDAKLRTQTRAEITALYRRTGKSFVYVTHDQVEAMTMGSRIIVLDAGRIQQVGDPGDIYDTPANTFVAQFIGSPPMNLLDVQVEDRRLWVVSGESRQELQGLTPPTKDGEVLLGIRPERMTLRSASESDSPPTDGLLCTVRAVERLGSEVVVAFSLGGDGDNTEPISAQAQGWQHVKLSTDPGLSPGNPCRVAIEPDHVCWFSPTDGQRIVPDQGPSRESQMRSATFMATEGPK